MREFECVGVDRTNDREVGDREVGNRASPIPSWGIGGCDGSCDSADAATLRSVSVDPSTHPPGRSWVSVLSAWTILDMIQAWTKRGPDADQHGGGNASAVSVIEVRSRRSHRWLSLIVMLSVSAVGRAVTSSSGWRRRMTRRLQLSE